MKTPVTRYKRDRFPPEIIQHAVWLHYRFTLSHRDIGDLLAWRGVVVTHESIRLWCNKFGPRYAQRLRRRHRGYGDTFHIDEVFMRIRGRQWYLWRAVDKDGNVVDVLLQERRNGNAAKRSLRRCLRQHHGEPRVLVTDELKSYAVAGRELIPESIHDTSRYSNNRAELSHQSTRARERGMRRFKSLLQAQRFVDLHAAVSNPFNLGRHVMAVSRYRTLRHVAFASWDRAVAI